MTDCIYIGSTVYGFTNHSENDRCYINSAGGKKCKPDNCPDKTRTLVNAPAYDNKARDSGYHWKSAMEMLIRLYSATVSVEQQKFYGDENYYKSRRDMGHFEFIPRDVSTLIEMFDHLKKHYMYKRSSEIKFLDCGCGVGNVVLLARMAGFDAYGVEYDEKTLNAGRTFLKGFGEDGEKRLFQGDLLTFDKFGDYDILYGYCPLSAGALEREFEQRLAKQMKIGAMVTGLSIKKGMKCAKGEIAWFQRLILSRPDDYVLANPMVKIKHSKF
jgi:hypothetical protein